jgi:hypothetical protein
MELLIRRKYHKAANVAKAISVLLLMVFKILGSLFPACQFLESMVFLRVRSSAVPYSLELGFTGYLPDE